MPVACPHCSATNPDNTSFCESCGKALPAAASVAPRIVGEKEFASSAAGRELQLQQLHRQSRNVSVTLFVLCVLQFLAAGLFFALSRGTNLDADAQRGMLIVSVAVGVIGIVFLSLGFWARRSPLPAAIVGLVLLISLWTADAVMDPTGIFRGIIVKIIVIGVLARAIQAGMKHRALKRELESGGAARA